MGIDFHSYRHYNYSKMFIRTKKQRGGQLYYYLVEAYRERGNPKPKQRVVRYLGKSKPSAEALQRIISEVKL